MVTRERPASLGRGACTCRQGLSSDKFVLVEGQVEGSDCQMISLLAFLEDENRNLRKAIIDLSLETLLLKSSLAS